MRPRALGSSRVEADDDTGRTTGVALALRNGVGSQMGRGIHVRLVLSASG
jgi:hypothetical protein